MRITATTVSFVLHPVGPLPASVYWRRRAVAFAAVILLLLVIWAVLPGGGGGGQRDSAAALTSTSTSGAPSPTVPAAAPTTPGPSGLSASPATDDPGAPADGPAATTTTVATPKPPPPAPKACADKALRLAIAPAQPAYVVGQAPVLRLQIRTVATVGCLRDLGAALQEVLLYRGSQRLWSSNDCYPEGSRDVELLRPGVVHTFSVTWSGLASQPKCVGTRTRVGAGTYTLVGRIGTLVSPRTPMTLRAA